MEKKESSAKTVNWEDEYNTWFCASDELLEDLMLNAHPTATGLLLTVENMTFKITRPDSTSLISCLAWVIEDKGSDQTAREIASMTHGQCMEMKFDSTYSSH
ncbi:MAG: hypothetical protein P4M11_15055 [Candidatus Pacebacteria bacterium]|nr:hypothetical protein [Candidatus Paceibacterota bacterium]